MTRPLYVAFVGMKRAPSSLPPDYWSTFVRFHLELPWYYARHSDCRVHLTTVEPVDYTEDYTAAGGGTISTLTEGQFLDPFFKEEHNPYDVVVHWRRWYDELYTPGARNVILSQDHSYSPEWKEEVGRAFSQKRLDGILVFPTWHKIDPFLRLWREDRRFHLTVTYPDYVRPESLAHLNSFLRHPGVRHLPGLRNGEQLWDLFNSAGFLPYSSTFPEPSSRCHRQAQAAGSVVLYPPGMGTPSELIGDAGIVSDPSTWAETIGSLVKSPDDMIFWGAAARRLAERESWQVQASRFYDFFSEA